MATPQSDDSRSLEKLLNILLALNETTPRIIPDPPTKPHEKPMKRASVALLLRIRPCTSDLDSSDKNTLTFSPDQNDITSTLKSFFAQPWVQRGTPELLYIKRAARQGDRWSGHVAFPGGHKESSDIDGKHAAIRETVEEIGIDLTQPKWIPVGRLDDREVTTQLRQKVLMLLSPYIFLDVSMDSTMHNVKLNESEVTCLRWVPINSFLPQNIKFGSLIVDLHSRIPQSWHKLVGTLIHLFIGTIHYTGIYLPAHGSETILATYPQSSNSTVDQRRASQQAAEKQAKSDWLLWGLTLQMTVDFMLSSQNKPASFVNPALPSGTNEIALADNYIQSLLQVGTPKFNHLDLNIINQVVNLRYKTILAKHKFQTPSEHPQIYYIFQRNTNWAPQILTAYYKGFAKALVIGLLLRLLLAVGGVYSLIKGLNLYNQIIRRKSFLHATV